MKTILIIEDEQDLAELVAFNLGKEGYRPLTALDGISGLEAARTGSPDLILLDLMLPGMAGSEICKALKGSPKTAAIPVIRIGPLAIDTERHQVTVDGADVTLTSTEFKLLLTLAERLGRLQSRELLLRDVWGYNYAGDTRTVDTHVTRLRTKLGESGAMIKTVRGFGYKMELE